MYCGNCGRQIERDGKFCNNCGTKVEKGEPSQSTNNEIAATAEAIEHIAVPGTGGEGSSESFVTKGLKLYKKAAIITVASLLVIAVAVYAYSNDFFDLFSSKSTKNSIVYLKGNELLFRNMSKSKSFTATETMFENKDEIKGTDFLNNSLYSSYIAKQEGNYLFFIDHVAKDGVANLYYRDTTKEKMDSKNDKGVKIAANITAFPSFQVLQGGKSVVYMKEYNDKEGGRFYYSDLKEEVKIDNNVNDYQVTEDGKFVVYSKDRTNDGVSDLYLKAINQSPDKEKIDTEVVRISKMMDNGNKIYYTKWEDSKNMISNLYLKEKGKDKVKLVSGIKNLEPISKNGIVVYTKQSDIKLYFKDLFDDDMASTDSAMTKPIPPNFSDYRKTEYYNYGYYGTRFSYETTDYDAYNKAYTAYTEKGRQYFEKLERDAVRSNYQNNPITITKSDLYIYANGKEEKVEEGVTGFIRNTDKSLIYEKLNYGQLAKKQMSQVKRSTQFSKSDFESSVYNVSTKKNLMLRSEDGKVLTLLEGEEYSSLRTNAEGSKVYMITDWNKQSETGSLMEYNIVSGQVQDKNKIESDVASIVRIFDSSKLLYTKNKKDGSAELYQRDGDKKDLLSNDVYESSVKTKDNGKTLYFYTDYSKKNNTGRLVLLSSGKKTNIADDVAYYYQLNNGKIAYITNYKSEKAKGDLWLKDSDKPVKIDEDVTGVISY